MSEELLMLDNQPELEAEHRKASRSCGGSHRRTEGTAEGNRRKGSEETAEGEAKPRG